MALMIGISGIRGLVGETLTPELVLEFAQAYGTLLKGGRLVLGRDSRPSGQMYTAAAATGLLATGCEVTDLGLVTTPTVGRIIRTGGYDGGICITASHNPAEWNGLKFLDNLGVAPDPERVRRIAEIRNAGSYQLVKTGFKLLNTDDEAGERHVARVLELLEVKRPFEGLTVVLDSINGAGCRHSPMLLEQLGCKLIHINAEPTGDFAHTPEPLRENLTQLCDAVRAEKAAIGFAQDPDADRLAIVDENGDYIGEEYTLALATRFVLSRRPGPVAANLSTSRMVDDIAQQYGARVIRTPVGEAHVARAMLQAECVVGGEGNGGVIDPRVGLVRDSLSSMSLVLQLMVDTNKSVSQLVAELPHYAIVKQKIDCPRERIDAAVAAVTRAFADRQPNTADGVRVDFPQGWVHVRASNTEPVLRLIAEADRPAAAKELVTTIRRAADL